MASKTTISKQVSDGDVTQKTGIHKCLTCNKNFSTNSHLRRHEALRRKRPNFHLTCQFSAKVYQIKGRHLRYVPSVNGSLPVCKLLTPSMFTSPCLIRPKVMLLGATLKPVPLMVAMLCSQRPGVVRLVELVICALSARSAVTFHYPAHDVHQRGLIAHMSGFLANLNQFSQLYVLNPTQIGL